MHKQASCCCDRTYVSCVSHSGHPKMVRIYIVSAAYEVQQLFRNSSGKNALESSVPSRISELLMLGGGGYLLNGWGRWTEGRRAENWLWPPANFRLTEGWWPQSGGWLQHLCIAISVREWRNPGSNVGSAALQLKMMTWDFVLQILIRALFRSKKQYYKGIFCNP